MGKLNSLRKEVFEFCVVEEYIGVGAGVWLET